MDEMGAVLVLTLVIAVLIFAGVGVTHTYIGVWQTDVVKACKEQGYWQTAQTRVTCSVQEPKK